MEVDKSPKASKTATSDKTAKAFSPIEHVTHLASMLLSLGDSEIYSRTYEELVRSVRSSGKVPADWDPPSADVRYEYMWDVPDSTAPGQVFGPYGEEEMKAWDAAAYFGPGAEKVKVRTVGGEWGKWKDVVL
jgi:CD2 antigen cytoplasmic tail-binding protein 2